MYQRTNVTARLALTASLLGTAMLLPIVGSILGLLGGKKALREIEETGEGGGGLAEAAVVFGWFGLISAAIGVTGVLVIIVLAAMSQ